MFFEPLTNFGIFVLIINQKEKDASIEILFKWMEQELIARNTNLLHWYQAKEKLALCIKGLFMYSTKEANKIPTVAVLARKAIFRMWKNS